MAKNATWPLHLCYSPGHQEFLRKLGRAYIGLLYAPIWEGLEKLNIPGPVILAPNHVCTLDHFMTGSFLPVHFGMGKAEFFVKASPRSGLLTRIGKSIATWSIIGQGMYPIVRPGSLLSEEGRFDYSMYFKPEHADLLTAQIIQALPNDNLKGIRDLTGIVFTRYLLSMGEWLIWFPQGTRHRLGDAEGAKRGLGMAVLDMARDYGTMTQVIPTALLYQKPGSYLVGGKRGRVRYADPTDYSDLWESYKDLEPGKDEEERRQIQQQFSDRVMNTVRDMLEEMKRR